MKVGMVGVGAMGILMAGHLIKKKHSVSAYDVNADSLKAAGKLGAKTTKGLAEIAKLGDVFIVMVATDDQVREITHTLAENATKGSVIAIGATCHPDTMRELGPTCAKRGIGLIDAPVVFGMDGARDGKLLSLVGGSDKDVERARPALMAYSRDALHVGPLGAGQLAKACNNLMHWIHCVGNFEVLALAKRYGVDAQRMREVLLQAPADNNTLRRWDHTRFTWQEKDMDVVMDLAQSADLVLPLTGQVDQLVKLLKADDVKALLYGKSAEYLGVKITPLPSSKGGLGS